MKESEKIPPNLYSMLFSSSEANKNKINQLLLNEGSDDEFYEKDLLNSGGENIFILDKKMKEERDRRLNEKDKIYKIKKHYFLKDSYKKIMMDDYLEMEINRLKQDEYIENCEIAEDKLEYDIPFNANDIYYLIKRNYNIFSKNERNDIEILTRSYKSYYYACGFSAVLLTSYVRAVMLYFRWEIKTKFISYLFLVGYGVGIFYSLKHFIDSYYVKSLNKFIQKSRDKILSYEYTFYKTPFGVDEKEFDPENINISDIFKF